MKLPIAHSYWVIPGKLLAGEHPAGGSPRQTGQRLAAMAAAGVRCFVDLTQPGEMPDYGATLSGEFVYRRVPVLDHGVPDSPEVMREVLAAIDQGLAGGGAVYVHCRAGIGRTGTAIGCFLRERGLSGDEALEELNHLWQQNKRSKQWSSVPETDEQYDYVLDWRPAQRVVDVARGAQAASVAAAASTELTPLSRHRACLVGLAIGDIASQPSAPPQARRWSDETAMAICTAESLLQCGGFNGRDQLERLRRWAMNPAADGAAEDATLRPSVHDTFKRALRTPLALAGSHDPRLIDPAALARCVVPALFATNSLPRAMALGGDVARVTHQAPLVVDTCQLFTGMLVIALNGGSREHITSVETLAAAIPLRDEVTDVARNWRAAPQGRRSPPPGILGCLDRAVRALLRTGNFEEGLTRLSTSPGRDPDATLAAYGALAGAHYGHAGLPDVWRARVAGLPRLEELATRLFSVSRTR